jgi:hypothetical protein
MTMMLGGFDLVQDIFKANDTYDMLQKSIQFFAFMNHKGTSMSNNNDIDISSFLQILQDEDKGYGYGAVPEYRVYTFEDGSSMDIREPIELLTRSNLKQHKYVCACVRHLIISKAVKFLDRTEMEDFISDDDDDDSSDIYELDEADIAKELEDMDKKIDGGS